MRTSLTVLALLFGGLALAGCVDTGVGSVSGALSGECGSTKTLMCHVPPGDPANSHEVCISNAAVSTHEAHGDYVGACGGGGGTCTADGDQCSVDCDCCEGHCNTDGICGPDAPTCSPENGACLTPDDCCLDPFGSPMGCSAGGTCYRQS